MFKRTSFAVLASAAISGITTGAHAADRAGETVRVQPASFQQGIGFFRQHLDQGDTVFREAKLLTEDYGSLEVKFDDDTSLTLGPRSEITIDDFVYSPGGSTGKAILRMGKGALRMISGRMPSESYQIRTATATIGVRGTEFILETSNPDITRIWVEDGTVLATPANSSTTFEFDAPAYAECSASACRAGFPGERPVTFPPPPPPGNPDNEGPAGDDDESSGSDF